VGERDRELVQVGEDLADAVEPVDRRAEVVDPQTIIPAPGAFGSVSCGYVSRSCAGYNRASDAVPPEQNC